VPGWNADLFARLVADKYGSINRFAREIDTSPQGVRAWLPPNGPGDDRRDRVAEALGVSVADLTSGSTSALEVSPHQGDRIEAKLDEALDLLRGVVNGGVGDGDAEGRAAAAGAAIAAAQDAAGRAARVGSGPARGTPPPRARRAAQ
jgi:hypothetical protein